VTVPENIRVGSQLTQVTAVDPDAGSNSALRYVMSSSSSTSSWFSVNQHTGVIRLTKSLDHDVISVTKSLDHDVISATKSLHHDVIRLTKSLHHDVISATKSLDHDVIRLTKSLDHDVISATKSLDRERFNEMQFHVSLISYSCSYKYS